MPTPVYVAPPSPLQQRPRRPQRRFRAYLIAVPGMILLFSWLISGVEPAVSWNDVMRLLHVQDRERFTEFCILALLVTAGVGILRVIRGQRVNPDE